MINKNLIGVEVISADPFIQGNEIDKNKIFGIFTRSYLKYRCDGVIQNNKSISNNRECGIACIGKLNFTLIEFNKLISFNKKAGIQIAGGAHCHIQKNVIEKNLG